MDERPINALRSALELERATLARARAQIQKLEEQLYRANQIIAGVPVRKSRNPSRGVLWGMCRFRTCRHLARYLKSRGRLEHQPCEKCARSLGRGANARALAHIRRKRPDSKIAAIARNIELRFSRKPPLVGERAAAHSIPRNQRVPAKTTAG